MQVFVCVYVCCDTGSIRALTILLNGEIYKDQYYDMVSTVGCF